MRILSCAVIFSLASGSALASAPPPPTEEVQIYLAVGPSGQRILTDPLVAVGEEVYLVLTLPEVATERRYYCVEGFMLDRSISILEFPAGGRSILVGPTVATASGRVVVHHGDDSREESCSRPVVSTLSFWVIRSAPPAAPGPPPPAPPAGPDPSPAPPASAPAGRLLPFPWPPPRPTVRDLLAKTLFDKLATPATFGEVANRLLEALDECGYFDRSFYGVPGGFALATRLEQIDRDGTPKRGQERWSKAVPPKRVFDLASFFSALFDAPEGNYRVIVFVAREGSIPISAEEADRETADSWALSGDLVLTPALARRRWTDRHHVTVLVYQYEVIGLHGVPVAHPEGAPPARVQLARSGLIAALTR